MSTDLRPDPDLAARAERTTPLMALDPDALLARAHRHVRRRTAARVTGGALAVAAIAVGGANLAAHRTETPDPAQLPTQAARPIGDEQVVEVAEGLMAANRPSPKRAPDHRTNTLVDDATWQVDLGLTIRDHRLLLAVGPTADEQQGAASYVRESPDGRADGFGGGVWTWGTPSAADGVRFGHEVQGGRWSELVVVPTTLRDPHVLLWSTSGFATATGPSVAVELPTFAAPDGQLLAAALGEPSVAESIQEGTSGVVFVGSDGRVVQAPCEDAPAQECPTVEEVPGLAAVIAAVASAPQASAATIRTLAEGVHATTALARSTGAGWDTGLRILRTWDDDQPGAVTLAPASETEVRSASDALDLPGTVGLRAVVAGMDGSSLFTWSEDDSPDRVPAETSYQGSSRWIMNDDVRLLMGVVPRWLPEGRVLLWLPRGVGGSGEEAVHALDVPTFADPTGTGARVYAVALDAGVAMIDLANARDALVLYVQDGARAWDVVDGSGTCTALPQDCLAAQPDGGAALVAALADRGVDVAGVPLGAGVTPPSGEPSAQELGPGITGAVAWVDEVRLDLGDVQGRRVWLELDRSGDVLVPTLYLDRTLPQNQPRQLDLRSMDGMAVPLNPDVRAFVGIGAAPRDGAWRAFSWSVARSAQGDLPLELPTVRRDGRAMFAYVVTEASGLYDTLSTDVWVSPSGEVWVADCEGMSEDECEESGATPGLFADVRAAIG